MAQAERTRKAIIADRQLGASGNPILKLAFHFILLEQLHLTRPIKQQIHNREAWVGTSENADFTFAVFGFNCFDQFWVSWFFEHEVWSKNHCVVFQAVIVFEVFWNVLVRACCEDNVFAYKTYSHRVWLSRLLLLNFSDPVELSYLSYLDRLAIPIEYLLAKPLVHIAQYRIACKRQKSPNKLKRSYPFPVSLKSFYYFIALCEFWKRRHEGPLLIFHCFHLLWRISIFKLSALTNWRSLKSVGFITLRVHNDF